MSPKTCTVLNCQSLSNDSDEKTFFKFPKNQERAKQWLKACGREDLLTNLDVVCQAYSNFFICEDHFDDSMYNKLGGPKRLCPTAVPIYFSENSISISEHNDIKSEINTLDEITVKEEPLRDPLESEIEIQASPPFIDISEDPQSGTMEFLPEAPVDYPYQEMVCSPIDISDDEEPARDTLPSSSNDEVSIDLTENESSSVMTKEKPVTGQPMATRHSRKAKVGLGNDIMECRTCLKPVSASRNARLYEKTHPDYTIKEMVSLCVPQMIPHLSDRDVICNNCLKRLRQSVTFMEDCLRSASKLKERQNSVIEFVEVPNANSKSSEAPVFVPEPFKNNQSILTSPLQRKFHDIEREGGYTCSVFRSHIHKLKELETHCMTHIRYCSVCNKRSITEDPQSETMEFLPEEPVEYPYQEMVRSPTNISDDEEPAKDTLPSSSNDDVSVDLTESESSVTGQNDIMECRTCLMPVTAARNARLYEKSHPDYTIKEMVSLCVPQMTPDLADGDVICRNCLKRLRQCVTFIEDCLRAEIRLKKRQNSLVEFVEVPKTVRAPVFVPEPSKNNQSILTSLLQGPVTAHPDLEKFKCRLCWRAFKTKYMLEDHQRKLHDIEREGGYNCNVCRVHFSKLKEMETHWMTHTLYGSVCNKRSMGNETSEHIEKNSRETTSNQEKETVYYSSDDETCKLPVSEVLYNCYKCERVIKGEAKYVSHIKMHGHPDRLFSCDKCPKSYGNYKVLRYHQMMSHEKMKTTCKFCPTSIWNYNMANHYRSRHGNEQLKFCKVCDDAFDNITEYRSHLREHIDLGHALGPSKRHSSSKNSNKNVQGETTDNGMQPVKCNICFLRFSTKRDLREHLKSHQNPINNETGTTDQSV